MAYQIHRGSYASKHRLKLQFTLLLEFPMAFLKVASISVSARKRKQLYYAVGAR